MMGESTMPYILPQDVTAPQEHWTLHRVIISGAPGTPAYALGTWDGERCLATRWNGTDDNETGWPRIFVHACWHIIDRRLSDSIISLLPDYRDKIYAMRFLAGEEL
jgi:hypothetical protein